MPYAGKTLMGRDVTAALAPFFANLGDVVLCKATSCSLGESNGSVGSWHDNIDKAGDEGLILSRDCGFLQHNIAAKYIGTSYEARLRTTSMDPAVYQPVVAYGAKLAWEKYNQPWRRDGKKDIRRFAPWYAYTGGWATFPEWWVWARPWLDHWAATGRYIQKAICGVANHYLVNLGGTTVEALQVANGLQAHFKVVGSLGIDQKRGIVVWAVVPKKPTAAPPDNVGPRPTANDGR
jgi:hypothetical protein